MATKKYIHTVLRRLAIFFKTRILHVSDSPHRIALGLALGLFVGWTPALGLHLLIALGASIMLRANKFAAVAGAWVCNPLTFVLIYYPNYLLGRIVLNNFSLAKDISNGQAQEIFERFVEQARATGLNVETGRFQQYMQVEIHNNGPVTILLDSKGKV